MLYLRISVFTTPLFVSGFPDYASIKTTLSQLRIHSFGPLITATLIALFLLLAAVYANVGEEIPFRIMFRDPVASLEATRFYGLFSQFGLIIWSIGAGALSLGILSRTGSRSYLIYSLIVTILLLLDDAFLVHELFGDVYNGLGEKVIFLGYGLAILAYLVFFRAEILGGHYVLLLVALASFAGSMGIDLVPRLGTMIDRDVLFFLEDGLKLLGIVFWTIFQCCNALCAIRR